MIYFLLFLFYYKLKNKYIIFTNTYYIFIMTDLFYVTDNMIVHDKIRNAYIKNKINYDNNYDHYFNDFYKFKTSIILYYIHLIKACKISVVNNLKNIIYSKKTCSNNNHVHDNVIISYDDNFDFYVINNNNDEIFDIVNLNIIKNNKYESSIAKKIYDENFIYNLYLIYKNDDNVNNNFCWLINKLFNINNDKLYNKKSMNIFNFFIFINKFDDLFKYFNNEISLSYLINEFGNDSTFNILKSYHDIKLSYKIYKKYMYLHDANIIYSFDQLVSHYNKHYNNYHDKLKLKLINMKNNIINLNADFKLNMSNYVMYYYFNNAMQNSNNLFM
jgi:hypothetical protein